MVSGIPGAGDSDRDALAALIEETNAGKNLLRVREAAHTEFPWVEQISVRNRIRATDSYLVRSRQKSAARIADDFRQEDLEPLIRIRQYVTKDHRLLEGWLSRNYPDSSVILGIITRKTDITADRGYSYMVDLRGRKPDLVRAGSDGFKRYDPRVPEKWTSSEFLDSFAWGGDDFVWYDNISEKEAEVYMREIDKFWKDNGYTENE